MTNNHNSEEWIMRARASGWGDFLSAALDVLEPFGVLGAQALWIAQPALGVFVQRETLAMLAQALEEPGGIDALRRRLEDSNE